MLLLIQAVFVFAQQTVSPMHPQKMEWQVGDDMRSALVYIPEKAKAEPVPIIFAFHGHGGSMYNIYRTRRFDQLWPDAIFICPQGLNTPGKLTDP